MSPVADHPPSLLADLEALRQQAQPADLAKRRRWLACLASILQKHQDEWVAAVAADFGQRSHVETRLAELFPALEGVRLARRKLAGWMRPQRRGVSRWFWPARAEVRPQALGVVGIMVPWNYPIFLAIGPLTSALAAGNRVMIKMSELSPHSGALLQRLCRQYLGDDVVRVYNGDVALAQAFAGLPFDHLLFTGSTNVGRKIMQAAAANLVPVTLELGGKSPLLVAKGFDPLRAAGAIVAGKMLNAGQTCVAPDYLLVHEDDCAALLAAIGRQVLLNYPTLAANPDYSAIISDGHYQRLCQWRDEAKAAGARITELTRDDAAELAASRKLPLTLVEAAPADCRLLQDEIFGPILPVVTYRDLAGAMAYINARPRPLALYLFSDKHSEVEQVLQHTHAGGVSINETLLHVAQDQLPFGGIGASGMGHYHGYEGFVTFSKLKPVFYQSRLAATKLTRPPYGKLMDWLLRQMLGR